MIDKLTKEQEEQLIVYRNKWLAWGLSTDRIDRKKAIENFLIFNKLVLGNENTPVIVFMDSPLTTWLATCLLHIWTKQVGSIGSQVWSQVGSQVGSQVRSQVRSFVYPYLSGQFDSSYFAFYDFCNNVLGIKFKQQKNWDCYLKLSDCSIIYPFKEFVVISEKPTQINMKNMLLHNETGASIEYADGFSVYSLNGVRVPKEIVMTSAEKLDPKLILKEQNAEVRREIVRKIGVERVCKSLNAKVIDRQDNYELLNLDLGDRFRPYLKMKNPSIGVYHIEGVHPDCDTVEKALNWRNGTSDIPKILT